MPVQALRIVEADLEAVAATGGGKLGEHVTGERRRVHDVERTCLGGEQRESLVMLRRQDDIRHARVGGGLRPGVRVERDRVELFGELGVFGGRDPIAALDPFADVVHRLPFPTASQEGIEPPVDEHPEPRVAERRKSGLRCGCLLVFRIAPGREPLARRRTRAHALPEPVRIGQHHLAAAKRRRRERNVFRIALILPQQLRPRHRRGKQVCRVGRRLALGLGADQKESRLRGLQGLRRSADDARNGIKPTARNRQGHVRLRSVDEKMQGLPATRPGDLVTADVKLRVGRLAPLQQRLTARQIAEPAHARLAPDLVASEVRPPPPHRHARLDVIAPRLMDDRMQDEAVDPGQERRVARPLEFQRRFRKRAFLRLSRKGLRLQNPVRPSVRAGEEAPVPPVEALQPTRPVIPELRHQAVNVRRDLRRLERPLIGLT